MGQLRNLGGLQFGFLIVTSRTASTEHKHRLSYWNCVCRCGRTLVVRSDALTGGTKRSCRECVIEYKLKAIFTEIRRGERDRIYFG
jgi:hypothetical protein